MEDNGMNHNKTHSDKIKELHDKTEIVLKSLLQKSIDNIKNNRVSKQ